jgi:predicted Zn finger-like uncharacterized protein
MATPASKFSFNQTPSGPKPLIIQCPSCSTKFALSSEAITGSPAPKFHCSRCDTIFSQEVQPYEDHLIQEAPQAESNFNYTQTDRFEEAHHQIEASMEPHKAETSLNYNDPIAADSFDFSFDEDSEKIFASFDSGIGDDSHSEISVAKFDDEPMGYGSLVREQVALHDPLSTSESIPLFQRIKIPTKYKALAYLTAPCIIFLFFASFIALVSSTAPSVVASAANLISSEKTVVAPRDIFVKNTKIKRIALDSGDMVTEITGIAVNKSSDTLRDIEIEAVVYDKLSKKVGTNKAIVSSNIGKSRLQSLTPEMIEDLQQTSSARSFSIKAGQEVPFSAVVVETPSKNGAPKFFTARVFSATKR